MGERAASLVKFEESGIASGTVSASESKSGLGLGIGTKSGIRSQTDIGTGTGGLGAGTGLIDDAACLETQAAMDFLAKLLHVDPHQRMSLRDAIHHPYLTHGVLRGADTDTETVTDLSSVGASSNRPSLGSGPGPGPGLATGPQTTPILLSPLTLHFQPPMVELPRSTPGGEVGADDQLWARRQFSSLWAPTPGELLSYLVIP